MYSAHKTRILGVMVCLLLLSAALVWHDLGTREVLGRDENLTITKLDQPNLRAVLDVTRTRASGQPSNMQPLYFLLQYLLWPVIGRSAFVLRFLPSVFALLTVSLCYKLGETLFSREAGLVAALFTALLPFHVQYAQIARPYSLLALFSLASAYFLVRGLQTNRLSYWAGFVLTAALNFYTHFNSLFVLAAEGLFTGVFWLVTLAAVQKRDRPRNHLIAPVLGFLLVGALCIPDLIRLSRLPWVESGGTVQVALTVPFFRGFSYRIGLTTAWLQGLLVGLAVLGLAATLYHRRWWAALLTTLWLALPFVVLSVMKSPRPFVERYVIFVPPLALLLASQGVITVGQMAGSIARRLGIRGGQQAAIIAASAGIALLLVSPLQAYYHRNRTEDRLDLTLTVIERHARAGDAIVVSPRFFIRPLSVDGAEVLYLTQHPSPAELAELTQRYQRIWILYTSYLPSVESQEPLDRWLQARSDQFLRVPIKAINALAYSNLAPTDAEGDLKDLIAVLEDLARNSAGGYEAWQRHGILANAYESLGELYDSHGNSVLAAEYRNKAEEARAAAPEP